MGKEKQEKMEFPYIYERKEMGIPGYGSKEIYLFSSFLTQKLGASQLDADPIFRKKEPTKIGCPFCKTGFLKLESVEPNYSGGPGPVPRELKHSGNSYCYICSNGECKAIFYGSIRWLYID